MIEAYIQDHIGGNHSEKTLEWHQTALGLMRLFLEEESDITQINDDEDLTTVQNYMHMNDTVLQEQKRKYSPGDHIPTRMPGPRETRRKGSAAKEQPKKRGRVNEAASSSAQTKGKQQRSGGQ